MFESLKNRLALAGFEIAYLGNIIWGGTTANTILGRRGQDNLIHGAQGNDRIVALGINDRIHGDDGFNTVVFQRSSSSGAGSERVGLISRRLQPA